MKKHLVSSLKALLSVATLAVANYAFAQTSIILDDFNASEGHFNLQPTFSGSTVGLLTTSTADRVNTPPPLLEGTHFERLVLNTNGAASILVRFLSGGGSAGGNTLIPTSAGTDGWIGFYARTTNTGWNAQIWLENAGNNGSTPKEVPPDGEWHLLEWNLDDTSGGADGWGNVAGIVDGSATVADGNHTIDSILFRNAAITDGTHVIDMDFVAVNRDGSVALLISEPCRSTATVAIDSGPLEVGTTSVVVKGVSASASAVKVYQNTGSSWALVGSLSSGIVAGNNTVPVSGLTKGAQIAATQTIGGQEGCEPDAGLIVGGGPNPSFRVAFSITETTESPTTIGQPLGANGNIHLLGSSLTGVRNGPIVYPSNTWQTVTIERVMAGVDDPANASGATTTVTPGTSGYVGGLDTVSVLVYAYKTVSGTQIFSPAGAASGNVTSGSDFAVNWTWAAVPGAEGYRLVRTWNSAEAGAQNVTTGTSFLDSRGDLDWAGEVVVTPKGFQTTPSIKWNIASGDSSISNFPGTWGALDAIAFGVDGDAGPYDIYIDDLMNGTTPLLTFEEGPAGMNGLGLQHTRYSTTTEGMLLLEPVLGQVSNAAASSGTKSFRARWQFKSITSGTWLRLTAYAAMQPLGNASNTRPAVRLDQPISFKLLMVPTGSPLPAAPPAPTLTAAEINGQTVLNWAGAHRLQAASDVSGPYTNLAQTILLPGTNTYAGPWTNSFTEPMKFFRLRD